MANKKVEEIETPAQAIKKLEQLSISEVKESIIQATRRKARAEEDLKYYKQSYGEVIKEEKEILATLLARLEFLYETDRVAAAKAGWTPKAELGAVVDDIRDATEQGDSARIDARRNFRIVDGEKDDKGGGTDLTADGEEFDSKTGELKG